MKIFLLLIIFCICFVVSALCVAMWKQCSVKEATLICRRFVKDTLKEVLCALTETEPKPEPTYPVLVGYTGYGFNPTFVEAEFSKIRENFASCYCTSAAFSQDGSYVMYRFDIMRKQDTLDDDTLTELIRKQAEETLAKNMRLCDCYLPAEPLTTVELSPHMLCIAYARNDTGIRQLAEYKHGMRKRKIMENQNRPNGGSMKEEWRDNER